MTHGTYAAPHIMSLLLEMQSRQSAVKKQKNALDLKT
ncbi:Uncharacterised protein [Legionella londiniensis]|nr:Uncharacterised protein [Legionella londiniensis]